MSIFKGFLTCISMFTVFPCKAFWEEKHLKWVIPTLNLLGLIIGLLWYYFAKIIIPTPIIPEFKALLLFVFPMLLSGFIHIDGLLDTADSLCSRQNLEKQKEILKDSRIGAFGAITLVMYMFFGYVVTLQMLQSDVSITIVLIPIISRYIASEMLIRHNSFSENGFADTFKKDIKAKQKIFMYLTFVGTLALALVFGNFKESLFLIMILCGTGYAIGEALCKHYKGVSGDLCGYTIAIVELLGMLIYSIMIL